MTFLMFICALALSSAAAYYSIVGLVAIFAAAPVPIVIMGSILEGSKLVVASWLYRNWKPAPILLRVYFIIALMVLMFLTSMGIFGFLSKAHIEQGTSQKDNTEIIADLERSIAAEQTNIQNTQVVIDQLDTTVQTLVKAERIRGPDGAIAVRKSQQEERGQYAEIIKQARSKIDQLEKQKLELKKEQIAFEAEVGPIKYIAALVYDETSHDVLEKAVRGMILLIVFVFDPLAVLMLIAANWSLKNRQPNPEPTPPTVEIIPVAPPIQSTIDLEDNIDVAEDVTTAVEHPVEVEEHPVFQPEDTFWRSRPPQ